MKKSLLSVAAAALLSTSALFAAGNTTAQSFNPFEEMQKMQQEMERIFNEFHQKFLNDAQFGKFAESFDVKPAVDLKDRGDRYVLEADMPGVDEKNIKISVKDGLLTIEAKSRREKREKGAHYLRQERFVGDYVRALSVPEDADTDHLKSSYTNGVLTITIPKKK